MNEQIQKLDVAVRCWIAAADLARRDDRGQGSLEYVGVLLVVAVVVGVLVGLDYEKGLQSVVNKAIRNVAGVG